MFQTLLPLLPEETRASTGLLLGWPASSLPGLLLLVVLLGRAAGLARRTRSPLASLVLPLLPSPPVLLAPVLLLLLLQALPG